jgi:hypothetical protein
MKKHILSMAKDLGVTIEYTAKTTKHIHIDHDARMICLPRKKTSEKFEYTALLHEIGHAYTTPKDYQELKRQLLPREIVRYESIAWQWARSHALIWTDSQESLARVALKSYIDYYGYEEEVEEYFPRIRG